MRKAVYTFLYIISLTIAGLSIHQAFAQQRAPSVEPLAEIEIGAAPSTGFDFSAQKRIPATASIRQKENSTNYSALGPILFFIIALPFALWMVISNKFKNTSSDENKSAYYSNVSQFTPYKTEYQKHDGEDVDDDDIDYPKSA